MSSNPKVESRIRRKRRVRRKVNGSTERPRLTVFKSNKHIYVQVIDDLLGVTLASACTLSPAVRDAVKGLKKVDAAKKVGELAAQQCQAANITKVVFDRNGYPYTGRVAALADAARAGGLDF
ncbi:MAG: 50S ribosomal protein L18 [Myxococcota bacterium]